MNSHQHATESAASMIAKAGPPAGVSIASVAGFQVSEILLWATLFYTVLMIGHKLWAIWKDVKGRD